MLVQHLGCRSSLLVSIRVVERKPIRFNEFGGTIPSEGGGRKLDARAEREFSETKTLKSFVTTVTVVV